MDTGERNHFPHCEEPVIDGTRELSEREMVDLEEERLIKFLSYASGVFRKFLTERPMRVSRILKLAEQAEKERNYPKKKEEIPMMTEIFFG